MLSIMIIEYKFIVDCIISEDKINMPITVNVSSNNGSCVSITTRKNESIHTVERITISCSVVEQQLICTTMISDNNIDVPVIIDISSGNGSCSLFTTRECQSIHTVERIIISSVVEQQLIYSTSIVVTYRTSTISDNNIDVPVTIQISSDNGSCESFTTG